MNTRSKNKIKIISIFLIILLSGCAGVGVAETSNPDVKLQQAEKMINEQRPLMADILILDALKIYKENKNTLGMAEAYSAYGNLHKNDIVNQYNTIYDPTYMKSINSFKKSKSLFQKANSQIGVVKTLVGIGMCYSIKKDKNKACPYYEDALSRYQIGKRDGTITKDPQMFIKGYANFGEIIKQIIKQEECIN